MPNMLSGVEEIKTFIFSVGKAANMQCLKDFWPYHHCAKGARKFLKVTMQDQQLIAQCRKCLVLWLSSARISPSHTWDWGQTEYLGFHCYIDCGLVRAFKVRAINGLSHSQPPKELLYFLYRFPWSHVPRETLLIEPSRPEAKVIQSIREWGPWTTWVYAGIVQSEKCHSLHIQ